MNGQGIHCKQATWFLVNKKGNIHDQTNRMNGKPKISKCAKLSKIAEIHETPETPEKSIAYRHSPIIFHSLFD